MFFARHLLWRLDNSSEILIIRIQTLESRYCRYIITQERQRQKNIILDYILYKKSLLKLENHISSHYFLDIMSIFQKGSLSQCLDLVWWQRVSRSIDKRCTDVHRNRQTHHLLCTGWWRHRSMIFLNTDSWVRYSTYDRSYLGSSTYPISAFC